MTLNLKEIDSVEKVHKNKNANVITHLKYLRKRTGLTLENLSQIAGISVSYLSRLESGARRLNTDLIRRLSKAFGCDPAELLQDTVHDESVLISNATRKIRSNFFSKENRKEKKEFRFDLPIYKLESENGTFTIDMNVISDFSPRPIELDEKNDAICIISESSFSPYFPDGAKIFLMKEDVCTPENTVMIVTDDNTVLLKKVWSVTPNSIQLCDLSKFEDLKSGKIQCSVSSNVIHLDSNSNLVEISSNQISAIYNVIGYIKA